MQPQSALLACLKTIGGVVNSGVGTSLMGVQQDRETVGVEFGRFPEEDAVQLHLVILLRDCIGPRVVMYIYPRWKDRDGSRVLVLECWPANSAASVKDGPAERFFVRTGAATTELSPSQTQAYIAQRF